MESDRTSNIDKTKNILDRCDNNPDRSTALSNPDTNKAIGDSAACVPDVPMATGESDKRVGGSEENNNNFTSVLSDMVRAFFEDKLQVRVSDSIPDEKDQHVDEIKREESISFILGPDREKVKLDDSTYFPKKNRCIDSTPDKQEPREQQSMLAEGVGNRLLVGTTGPTNVCPSDVEKTMPRFGSANTSSPTNKKQEEVSDLKSIGTDTELPAIDFSLIRVPEQALSDPISISTDLESRHFQDSKVHSPTKREPAESDPISVTDSDSVKAYMMWLKKREVDMKYKCGVETGALPARPAPPPKAVVVCDPRFPTPFYDKLRKLALIGENLPADIRKPATQEFNWLCLLARLNKKREQTLAELKRKQKLLQAIEKTFERLTEPVQVQRDEYRKTTEDNRKTTEDNRKTTEDNRKTTEDNRKTTEDNRKTTEDNRKTTEDNRKTTEDNRKTTEDNRKTTEDNRKTSGLPKPTVQQEKPNVPSEENPFDIQEPPPPYEHPCLKKYCDASYITAMEYPSPPSSLDGSDWEEEDFTGFSELSSKNESHDEHANVTSDKDEAIGVKPSESVSNLRNSSKTNFFPRKNGNSDSQFTNYLKSMIEATVESMYNSPEYDLKKVPESLAAYTLGSVDESNHGSPALKKNMTNCLDGKNGPVQKYAVPEHYDDDFVIMKVRLDENEKCDQYSSHKFQRGGVKRLGSNTVESPKKRKLPEGAVSPCTEVGIPVAPLNPDDLCLQEKTTSENEVEGGAKKVGGIKGQESDASDRVSPCTKACIPAPASNPDALKAPTENEVEVCSKDIGGVKRRGINMRESPNKRKHLEDPVSPYTKAFISAPPSNADVISLQKTDPTGHGVEVGTKEMGVGRHCSVIIESPKKRKKLEYTVSPYAKAVMSAWSINPDDLNFQRSDASRHDIKVDSKEVEVKRLSSDIMESPKKRRQLEDPVLPYTKACVSAESSNSDGLNIKKITPTEKQIVICAKEVKGDKRQWSDIMESPKKNLSDETVSPEVIHGKEGIPASFSNSEFLAWVSSKLSFTPKNLKQLEDEVVRTIARLHVSSSNSETLNDKEVENITKEFGSSYEIEKNAKCSEGSPKKPVEETEDGSKSTLKYLIDRKRRLEGNLKHLKRLIKLVAENLEGTKDNTKKDSECLTDTGHSMTEYVNNIRDTNEIDSKPQCLVKNHESFCEKENLKRDRKPNLGTIRIPSPLYDFSVGKRSPLISPPIIDEQECKS